MVKAVPGLALLFLGCTSTEVPIYQPTAEGSVSSYDYCPAFGIKSAAATFSRRWGNVYVAFVQRDALGNAGAFQAGARRSAKPAGVFSICFRPAHPDHRAERGSCWRRHPSRSLIAVPITRSRLSGSRRISVWLRTSEDHYPASSSLPAQPSLRMAKSPGFETSGLNCGTKCSEPRQAANETFLLDRRCYSCLYHASGAR